MNRCGWLILKHRPLRKPNQSRAHVPSQVPETFRSRPVDFDPSKPDKDKHRTVGQGTPKAHRRAHPVGLYENLVGHEGALTRLGNVKHANVFVERKGKLRLPNRIPEGELLEDTLEHGHAVEPVRIRERDQLMTTGCPPMTPLRFEAAAAEEDQGGTLRRRRGQGWTRWRARPQLYGPKNPNQREVRTSRGIRECIIQIARHALRSPFHGLRIASSSPHEGSTFDHRGDGKLAE